MNDNTETETKEKPPILPPSNLTADGYEAALRELNQKLAEMTKRAERAEARIQHYRGVAMPENVTRLEAILQEAQANTENGPTASHLCQALTDALDCVHKQAAASQKAAHAKPFMKNFIDKYVLRNQLTIISAARPRSAGKEFDVLEVFQDWYIEATDGKLVQLPAQFVVGRFQGGDAVLCDLEGKEIAIVDSFQVAKMAEPKIEQAPIDFG